MSDPYHYPKLRWPLDLSIEKVEGREILLLRDPSGITPEPLLLVAAVTPLIASFEGNLSIDDIVQKFSPQGATKELVEQLVGILDQSLFLATPRYFTAQQKIKEDFMRSDVRPAALAGPGYSANPENLRRELARFLNHQKPTEKKVPSRMLGLIAPHIDYRRGGNCYGVSYNQLKPNDHDLYLLVGTSHQYSKGLFHLTKKHFDSPLGQLPCDTSFVEKLATLYGHSRSFADELLHRREHSLELQVPFLKEMEKRSNGMLRSAPKIVPILVGSFHTMYGSGKYPSEFDEYESFIASLTECVKKSQVNGQRICFIAGVDMAHMGRSFGDPGALTPQQMKDIETRDRLYLDAVSRQDKLSLFAHVAEDNNARKICGFPTLYTMIDLFDRLNLKYEAELFDYSQTVDYDRDCAVTFAGMGLYACH